MWIEKRNEAAIVASPKGRSEPVDSPDRKLHVLLQPVLGHKRPGELVHVVTQAAVHTEGVVAPHEWTLTCEQRQNHF